MKIKAYLSKCKEVLIIEHNGDDYPFDVDKDVLNQAFNLAKQFATKKADYMPDKRFKRGRLVLSVNLPDKMPSRVGLGALL